MPTTTEVNTAATNFIADTDTADAKINGAAGTVTDRHGAVTLNLEARLNSLGYQVPVAFASGISVTAPTQTVIQNGNIYFADPASVPFTTTSTFNNNQWHLMKKRADLIDFGGIPDDTSADNSAALIAAFTADPSRIVIPRGKFTFKTFVSLSLSEDLEVDCLGSLSFLPSAHAALAFRLTDTSGVRIELKGLEADGNKLCNRFLEVLNNTSNDTPTDLVMRDCDFKRVKRLNTFSGGSGVLIQGAFSDVRIDGGSVRDCELPAGQGTPGSVGVVGISATWYSTTSYIKKLSVRGTTFEKIYSSDGAYTADQDGIKYFAPDSATDEPKVTSMCSISEARFKNCFGRSIKTQVAMTVVRDCVFERDNGPTGGVGNDEIGSQTGNARIVGNIFHYSNGQVPSSVFGQNGTARGNHRTYIAENHITVSSGTSLAEVFQAFGSSNQFGLCSVMNNTVVGEHTKLVDFTCAGEGNMLEVKGNMVDNVAIDAASGDRALIFVRTSGSGPHYATVRTEGNQYLGSETVHICRDAVPGTSMRSLLSSLGNVGFEDVWNGAANDNTPNGTQALVVDRITSSSRSASKGYMGPQHETVAAGSTVQFPVRHANACFVLMQVSQSHNCYALFSCGGSNISEVASGSSVELANSSEPATGDWRVWMSSGNVNVKNTTANDRTVILTVFAPN